MSHSRYVPGTTYVPDMGDHTGHRVMVVSNDTRRITLPGSEPVRHVLVRCTECLLSWTFGGEA